MATIELAVDLGSKRISIFQKGIGLVLSEPTIAIATKVKDHYEIREAGFRAESIMTNSLGGAKVIAPVREGLIIDDEMFTLLLKHFLKKITPEKIIPVRIKAIVAISCAMTNSDRKAVEKCFVNAGIKEVTLVESPLCLIAYTKSIGGLFVDIGGGKTEIAAVTNRGIACGCAVNIAGDAFNNEIIDRTNNNYGVKLGEYTIETLKKNALSFYVNDEGVYAVSGSGNDGTPKNIALSAKDMREAVIPLVDDIAEVVGSVLSQTPPELVAEVLRKGIFITGGSTHIPGLVDYMTQKIGLPVTVLDDVDNAVVTGAAKFFDDKRSLSNLLGVQLD